MLGKPVDQDAEHLRLLSIFHYVMANILALFGLFPIFHIGFGLAMFIAPEAFKKPADPEEFPTHLFGLIFVAVGGFLMLMHWSFALAALLAGRSIARRRCYLFCLLVAGILCLHIPHGTALGVFTIIVLVRPSVKQLFVEQAALRSRDY